MAFFRKISAALRSLFQSEKEQEDQTIDPFSDSEALDPLSLTRELNLSDLTGSKSHYFSEYFSGSVSDDDRPDTEKSLPACLQEQPFILLLQHPSTQTIFFLNRLFSDPEQENHSDTDENLQVIVLKDIQSDYGIHSSSDAEVSVSDSLVPLIYLLRRTIRRPLIAGTTDRIRRFLPASCYLSIKRMPGVSFKNSSSVIDVEFSVIAEPADMLKSDNVAGIPARFIRVTASDPEILSAPVLRAILRRSRMNTLDMKHSSDCFSIVLPVLREQMSDHLRGEPEILTVIFKECESAKFFSEDSGFSYPDLADLKMTAIKRGIRQFASRRLSMSGTSKMSPVFVETWEFVNDTCSVSFRLKKASGTDTESSDWIVLNSGTDTAGGDRHSGLSEQANQIFQSAGICLLRKLRQQKNSLLTCHSERNSMPALRYPLTVQLVRVMTEEERSLLGLTEEMNQKNIENSEIYDCMILQEFILASFFRLLLRKTAAKNLIQKSVRSWPDCNLILHSSMNPILSEYDSDLIRLLADLMETGWLLFVLEKFRSLYAGLSSDWLCSAEPCRISIERVEAGDEISELRNSTGHPLSWAWICFLVWFFRYRPGVYVLHWIQREKYFPALAYLQRPSGLFTDPGKTILYQSYLHQNPWLFFGITQTRILKRSAWLTCGIYPGWSGFVSAQKAETVRISACPEPYPVLPVFESLPEIQLCEPASPQAPALSDLSSSDKSDSSDCIGLVLKDHFASEMTQKKTDQSSQDRIPFSEIEAAELTNRLFKEIRRYHRLDLQEELEKETPDHLHHRLLYGPLLGVDLLPYLCDPDLEKGLYKKADEILWKALYGFYEESVDYPVIAASLICASARYYFDSQFYPFTRKIFPWSYERHGITRVETFIRKIAGYYSGYYEVSYFIRQAMFPQPYLRDALRLAGYLYQEMEYSLPEHPETALIDLFRNYRQLLRKRNSDSTAASVGLIESVQWILNREKYYPVLIDYMTIVLKNMDACYWQSSAETCEYSSYFQPALADYRFERRIRHLRTGAEHHSRKRRQGLQFHLTPGKVRIRTDTLEIPESAAHHPFELLLLNQDQLLKKQNDLRIIFEHDQYLVESVRFTADSPLGSLRIQIRDTVNGNVIFDSKNELYRNWMIFNSAGREISESSLRKDIYSIVAPRNASTENMLLIDQTEHYSIWQLSLDSAEDFGTVDGHILSVCRKNTIHLEGVESETLKIIHGNRSYPVYRKIDSVRVLVYDRLIDDLYMLVDEDQRIRTEKSSLDQINQASDHSAVFFLNDLKEPGYHSIRIYSFTERKEILRKEFFLAEISDLIIELDNDEYPVVIFNNLFGDEEDDPDMDFTRYWEGKLQTDQEEILPIICSDPHFAEPLKVHVELNQFFYRTTSRDFFGKPCSSEWLPFTEPILSGSFDSDSRIYFEGPKIDHVEVVTGKEVLADIPVSSDSYGRQWITAERLLSLSDEIPRVHLLFRRKSVRAAAIEYLLRTVIDRQSLHRSLNRSEGKGQIEFSLAGPDPATVRVYKGNECIFERELAAEDFDQKIRIEFPADVLTDYRLDIEAGTEDLFSQSAGIYSVFRTVIRFPVYDPAEWTEYQIYRLTVDGNVNKSMEGKDCRIYLGKEIRRSCFEGLLVTTASGHLNEQVAPISVYMDNRKKAYAREVSLQTAYGRVVYDLRTGNLTAADISADKDWANHYIDIHKLQICKKR